MSALVPSWGLYAAARVVVGIGFGANMVVACVYPLEFVGRQWRVLCGTIGFWSLGSMALAGVVSNTFSTHSTVHAAAEVVSLRVLLFHWDTPAKWKDCGSGKTSSLDNSFGSQMFRTSDQK